MTTIDLEVASNLVATPRVKQLSGMFDVPLADKLTHRWQGDIPLEQKPWQLGLIVGPSGCGKSSILRHVFGEPAQLQWNAGSVIDDFGSEHGIEKIAEICSAVGFNTIPSWCKPHSVLSTGEKFRVEVARQLLEGGDTVPIDEFTSVVDRQVAQIGSHAVQKYVRKHPNKKLVAASCHYDIIEWLQPDWLLEPATMTFQWRSVQRRPALAVEISRVDYPTWRLFAPFHYLTAELHRAARCFCLFVNGTPASFIAMINIPHPKRKNLRAISRAVTLPDYQGMGLVMFLESKVCGAYRALGIDVHGFPAHPSHIRSLDRSPDWRLLKKPGSFAKSNQRTQRKTFVGHWGGRPCAMFEFCGPAIDKDVAKALLGIEGALG